MVTLSFTGGCISSCFKLVEKTLIAEVDALSLSSERISLSIEGNIRREYASSAAAFTVAVAGEPSLIWFLAIINIALSLSKSIETFKKSSFSPRFMAKILWSGILATLSE